MRTSVVNVSIERRDCALVVVNITNASSAGKRLKLNSYVPGTLKGTLAIGASNRGRVNNPLFTIRPPRYRHPS
jgi:hypothetical protein